MSKLLVAMAHSKGPQADDAAVLAWWKGCDTAALGGPARLFRLTNGFPDYAVLVEAPSDGAQTALAEGSADILTFDPVLVGTEIFLPGSEAGTFVGDLAVDSHIYMPMLNPEKEIEADFNEWYNTIHVPMVDEAGLRKARRYTVASGLHKYMAAYVMDDADVLRSEAIQRVRGFDHFTGRVHDLTRIVAQTIG